MRFQLVYLQRKRWLLEEQIPKEIFDSMKNENTRVVKIHDVNIDKDYMGWIEELKSRYRRAQIKAAVKVNAEKLLFNWELGRDLVIRKAEEIWGAGVVEQLSLDLKAAFPESKGFSARNLWYMKDWFSFYSPHTEKLHQLDAEFQSSINQVDIKLHQAGAELINPKLQQSVGELQFTVNHGIAFQVKSNWHSVYASYKRSCRKPNG